tara:strand:- start:32 stop:229 length:198 start_codon:yes stop_codon:yes gene_type:complete
MYKVFIRTWWIDNKDWPKGLEPCVGKSRTIKRDIPTEDKARQIAQEWNANNEAGRYSLKAEFDYE